ncbi:ABC transporter substrate-binding protein [Angustibacter peucedani]
MRPTRLRGLAAATLALLALAACSTGPADAGSASSAGATSAAPDAFPVTVEHAFGSTTIPRLPQRVATVAWVNADTALALGVVPVGMPKDEWGGNEHGSTPWKDAALTGLGAAIGTSKAPAQYSEADGINFAEIAKTTPDVILAAYSGLTKADYDKLSKIAPVVAYPDVAWGTPWQESTRMIGTALGRSAQAEQLVTDTEKTIKDEAAKYPQLAGKTFIYGNLEPSSGAGINIYTPNDNRPRFLTQLGMTLAPVVADKTKGGKDFFIEWSPERADELAADVFVTWVPDAKTEQAITDDPLFGQIPAVKQGSLVADSDNTLTLSISASNPLSLPWALDTFLPQLAAAADAADAADKAA